MPALSLSANIVKSACCPPGKQRIDFFDTGLPGFLVEVRASGGKTYYLRYRDVRGKQRQYRIGDSKSLSFDAARREAQQLRMRVVLGENPCETKALRRVVPTLQEFIDARYLPYIKGYKRSWKTDVSILNNHILPALGALHLDAISPHQLMLFQHAHQQAGYAPASSNRLIILLRYLFNLAIKWEIPGATVNPAKGVTLFEENNQREHYLSPAEAGQLYAAIQKSHNPQLPHIIAMLLLTGCRKREVLDARWEDMDLLQRNWRIPMSKSGKSRHVPLSDGLLQLLAQIPRFDDCPYVVPNPRTRKPYGCIFHSWDIARREAGMPELRIHDLRHTFASFLINAGRSLYEVQNILGHTQQKTTQRYSHLSQTTLLQAANAAMTATGFKFTGLKKEIDGSAR